MENFLENVSRLFRFFFSSSIGLVSTIINPFLAFFARKNRWYAILAIALATSILVSTIYFMLNPD
uniref:hypothetical protein n=1 Tax=Timspurckia oligopyrenoides TaxID=708627 RepID=UPI001FCDD75E|nr:hypothetical protein MW591_pgp087 [Timspurckia oligopyrenoides]UNJ17528.1 hypothetical protein [Timspurckia oligopyrenoides]